MTDPSVPSEPSENADHIAEVRTGPGPTPQIAGSAPVTPQPPQRYGPPEGQGPPGAVASFPGYGQPPGYEPPPGYGPPPNYGWETGATSSSSLAESGDRRRGGILHNAVVAWITAAVLAVTVIGLAAALASTNTGPTTVVAPSGSAARGSGGPLGGSGFGGGRGLGSLGVTGTVTRVGSGSFTVTDRAGAVVTVDEQSSTAYSEGATAATSSAVVTGVRVVVQGTRTGSTVQATRVIVLPAGGFGFGPGAGAGTGAGAGSTS